MTKAISVMNCMNQHHRRLSNTHKGLAARLINEFDWHLFGICDLCIDKLANYSKIVRFMSQ